MRELRLAWAGPFRWFGNNSESVFQVAETRCQGVYVWTAPFGEAYVAYYVGETGRSFNDRLREHARDYLGGIYRLWDPDAFAACDRGQALWDGLWREGTTHRMGEFLNGYPRWSQVAYALLGSMRIWLLPFSEDERTRKRVEAAIGKLCREAPPPGRTFFDDVVQFQAAPDAEAPLIVQTDRCPILGVPAVFNA